MTCDQFVIDFGKHTLRNFVYLNSIRALMKSVHGKLSGKRVKRRVRQEPRAILRGCELCAHFGVEPEALELYLHERALPYHKDANNDLWASIEIAAHSSLSRIHSTDN